MFYTLFNWEFIQRIDQECLLGSAKSSFSDGSVNFLKCFIPCSTGVHSIFKNAYLVLLKVHSVMIQWMF